VIKIEHAYTNRVICPHCGHEHDGSWEWSEDGEPHTCHACNKQFMWERNVEVSYSTWKVREA
jgi:transposase-like protein